MKINNESNVCCYRGINEKNIVPLKVIQLKIVYPHEGVKEVKTKFLSMQQYLKIFRFYLSKNWV